MSLPDKPDLLDLDVRFISIPTVGLSRWEQAKALLARRRVWINRPFVVNGALIPSMWASDGMSLPRGVRSLADPWGISLLPSISHDFSTRFRVRLDRYGNIVERDMSRKRCDEWMKRDMDAVNGMPAWSKTVYGALRTFGGLAWNKHRKKDVTGINDISTVLRGQGGNRA